MNSNFFDPRFGKKPARLIGRDDVLRDIRSSLEDPHESKTVTIFSGIKGSGKTAMLSEIRSWSDPSQEKTVFFFDDAEDDIESLRDFLIAAYSNETKTNGSKIFIAALPHTVQELLKDKELSLGKRSYLVTLSNIRIDEVLFLYEELFSGAGKTGSKKIWGILKRAAEATMGYPYLIQLIGYYLSKEENGIDDKAVDRSVFRAKIELYKNIHEPLVWSLSSKDRMFLWSMSQDAGPSEFGEIAKRMDVSAGYASKYRERLISADVIYSSSYGELTYALPYMKEYVEKEYIERLGGEGGKRRL